MEFKYPYIQCLDPQLIYNKYIGESVLVPCGKCQACLNRKASRNALKCRLESLSHTYTMFVTLTYNQVSVPLMQYKNYRCSDYKDGILYELTSRLRQPGHYIYNNQLGKVDLPPFEHGLLKKKCETFNLLPHLSKRDAQLFIKRLRKYISKISDEKIRYYLVGEYGPIHFRPHYHLLLWFSDKKIFKAIQQTICKSWRYGLVRAEVARGDCSNYVAKYLNGNCSLPRVFMQKSTSCFCLHSHHLGENVLAKNKQEIYASSAREINRRSINFSNGLAEFTIWRSLKTTFFPKCKGFALLSDSELYFVYRLYRYVRNWTKKNCLASQARYILDTILGVIRVHRNIQQFHSDPNINDILMYFYKSADINPCCVHLYKEYWSRIYMELRLSRHFLRFVCDHTEDPEVSRRMISRIKDYWHECDRDNLIEQLNTEADCEFEDEEEYQYFYSNLSWNPIDIQNTKEYRMFKANTIYKWNKGIKHKELNDRNRIFMF